MNLNRAKEKALKDQKGPLGLGIRVHLPINMTDFDPHSYDSQLPLFTLQQIADDDSELMNNGAIYQC